MKIRIELALGAALTLTLIGVSSTLAQRSGTESNVTPQRPKGPCDIYAAANTPCVAAHSSTRALYASYNGPLYQVLRQSDGKTLDIGILSSPQIARSGCRRIRRRRGAGRVLRQYSLLDQQSSMTSPPSIMI